MVKVKVVAFSCLHAPYTDKRAFGELVKLIKSERPTHLVNLGDWFESAAASVHPEEHEHTLEDEYKAAAEQSEKLRHAAPRAGRIWCIGNHDDNLQCPDPRRIPRALRGSVHWNVHGRFGQEFRRWYQVPYRNDRRGVYRIGNVLFLHGWSSECKSDFSEAVHVAQLVGGESGLLVIRGHTHRPRDVSQCPYSPKIMLPYWVANAGTIGPLKPHYMMRRDTSQWGAGAIVVKIKGKEWEAHLERL
jgi:predicted phosphodiesterase